MTRRGGGGGVIASNVGAETLAGTLALGNTTGANDLIVSSSQKIQAANAATGVTLTLEGGVGSAGVGGGLTAAAGSGSTDGGVFRAESGEEGSGGPGKIEFVVGGSGSAPTADKGFHFLLGTVEIARIAIEGTSVTNGAGQGFYIPFEQAGGFDFGWPDRVSAGNGNTLNLIGQTVSNGTGGDSFFRAGNAGGTNKAGGTAEVRAGTGTGSAAGGDGIIEGASSGSTGKGGNVVARGANGGASGGNGGNVQLSPGTAATDTDGGVLITVIKSGATQGASGAVADELWKTASHATLPDNVLMIGV